MIQDPTSSRPFHATQFESTLLASLIDTVVSEKRVALREKNNVQIEARLENSYGLFANINPIEMKRVLSNIITNAVEAIEVDSGLVEVIVETLESDKNKLCIKVKDNGKGIPHQIIEKLGHRGVTHGKVGSESGSGLGVYHAKQSIESYGGTFKVESKEGLGTSINMSLQKSEPPFWFAQKLAVANGQIIVATDDDNSVLEIWRQRLSRFIKNDNIQLITCMNSKCLRNWISENSVLAAKALFLIDYEFVGQKQNGLDLVEDLKIENRAILVSSRYDEESVKSRCEQLGVKMIPKGMAPLIPITIDQQTKVKFDSVLLDDDRLVHSCWKMDAEVHNKTFKGFYNFEEFVGFASELDFESPIYVDSNLGNGIKGEIISKKIYELGFKNVNLCTGYDSSQFEPMPWIRSIVGKEPI